MSHLAKVVLEEHGYEVELQNADLAPSFVSMSGKKSDVFLDEMCIRDSIQVNRFVGLPTVYAE